MQLEFIHQFAAAAGSSLELDALTAVIRSGHMLTIMESRAMKAPIYCKSTLCLRRLSAVATAQPGSA